MIDIKSIINMLGTTEVNSKSQAIAKGKNLLAMTYKEYTNYLKIRKNGY